MDCFFVSCEVKRKPYLKGKPVVVGATGQRGVVCAASYEARKYGVRSATPISIARRRLPHGIYLPPEGRYYRNESRRIMHHLSTIADDMEQVSVDEAYLDITSLSKKFDSLARVARYIQALIQKKTKLPCSVGIADSRTVAKIASDHQKPFGLTIVEDTKEFLNDLPIEKIPGVGKKSKIHFNNNGVYKIKDLLKMDRFDVIDRFGMHGVQIQQIALGEIKTGIYHYENPKSISREVTFSKDTNDEDTLDSALVSLCRRVYDDLEHRAYRKVSIKLRYSDFTTITRDITLKTPDSSVEAIKQNAKRLLIENIEEDEEVRLIGVKLSNLIHEESRQMTLGVY